MLDKLRSIVDRYNTLERDMADPVILANQSEWQKIVKEHAAIQGTVELFKEYAKLEQSVKDCREIIDTSDDDDMIDLAKEELSADNKRIEKVQEELKISLIPPDPNDDNNVIIEVRPAAGGDESALFGAELVRMYMRYAERKRWKVKELDMNFSDLGGVKECTFMISGNGAYRQLKFESGVHRVQRVPETESQGRVHTSTCTVAVLPEIEEVEFEILDKDIKVDTYRSGGAGGQHVNKTESAIRITHLPTGLVVTCQDEKSQIKNRESAMKVLKTRLHDHYASAINKEYSANRKLQVGTGDRSERIRTFNFPQGRVTDHRIGFTMYSLEDFLDGNIFELLEALALAHQADLLNALNEQ